jgi:hypothetical protein
VKRLPSDESRWGPAVDDDELVEVDEELLRIRRIRRGLGRQIPRTTVNIRLKDARALELETAVAILSQIAAHDIRVGAAVGLLAAALDRVRILSDEEMEVFGVMQKLSFGKIYRVWVDEADIIEALPSDRGDDTHKRTLANMKSRGILEEGAGKWPAVL